MQSCALRDLFYLVQLNNFKFNLISYLKLENITTYVAVCRYINAPNAHITKSCKLANPGLE